MNGSCGSWISKWIMLGERRSKTAVRGEYEVKREFLLYNGQCCIIFAAKTDPGASVMAQCTNPPRGSVGSPMVPVGIPAAPVPIRLPAYGLKRQWSMIQSSGTSHLHGIPGRSSWFLASGWLSPGTCGHLGKWTGDARSFCLSLLQICLCK